MSRDLTRRSLLAGGALIGPTTLLGANAATEPIQSTATHGRLSTDHPLDADIVVAGGGLAGVCTALAAARHGASVILVQDRPLLGGNSSSEIRLHVLGADATGHRKTVDARETGIMEELRLTEAVSNPQRSTSVWDIILYDAVRSEPNITLLLNTHCCGVRMADDRRIEAMIAARPSTEDVLTLRGRCFVDCTGDGRLGAEAGADFRVGREARGEYGESLAPEQADHRVLSSSILFQSRLHDRPMPFKAPAWAHHFASCDDLPHRDHNNWEWGHWWVAWGGERDIIKDNEQIRDRLLAYALGLWDHIKNSGQHPTSANWALEWIGFLPAKRESRRFIGEHVLTQQEVQRGETFEDGVAFGGWPIDLHPAAGIESKDPPCHQVHVPLYNIPFRCLYSRNIHNLLFAGRNASSSHVAFGSTRVMATGGAMGQAVGTAAAICVRSGITPSDLVREGIRELQQTLLRDDAYIIAVTNSDPLDLARKAAISASSETADGPATAVTNGVHRGVGKAGNRWISDPSCALPQTLELRFAEPARVREVHLVFDTGLHRALMLTLQDSIHNRMTRGPQPETVRDYELRVIDGHGEKVVADVTGNYQRKRIHRFDAGTIQGLRLVVKATNGDKSARLFEVRAYA